MNPEFRWLVKAANEQLLHFIDRCQVTILIEHGYVWTVDFLAEQQVEIVASLLCYLEKNSDVQRGEVVFEALLKYRKD